MLEHCTKNVCAKYNGTMIFESPTFSSLYSDDIIANKARTKFRLVKLIKNF